MHSLWCHPIHVRISSRSFQFLFNAQCPNAVQDQSSSRNVENVPEFAARLLALASAVAARAAVVGPPAAVAEAAPRAPLPLDEAGLVDRTVDPNDGLISADVEANDGRPFLRIQVAGRRGRGLLFEVHNATALRSICVSMHVQYWEGIFRWEEQNHLICDSDEGGNY